MKSRLLVGILLLVGFCSLIQAQVPMKIPYELVGGKMRVKVFVNNDLYLFIFDTGGKTTITKELQEKYDMPFNDSIYAVDVTSKKQSYAIHSIGSVMFENKEMNISDVPVLVLNKGSQIFEVFNAVGIIGNDVLSHFVMEINSREKLIHLLPSTYKTTVSLRNMIKFEDEENASNMPLLKLGLGGGETLKVLFDTGAGPFLTISNTAYEQIKDTEAISDLKEGISRSLMGISGAMQIEKEIRLALPLLTITTKKFHNVNPSVSGVPVSLLGTSLLRYGKVTIDYPRSRFFFEPFGKEPEDLTESFWDIGLTVVDGELQIASLWGNKRKEVNIGDRVIRIDGEEVPELDFSKTLLSGLEMLRDKKSAKLSVESNGTIKEVLMEKK